MNKAFIILGICVICSILISGIPAAVESAAPVCRTVSPQLCAVSDKITAAGTLAYSEQNDITAPVPLVIDKFLVKTGDSVSVGDVIATVDRNSTLRLLESAGEVISASKSALASTFIPETVTADCSGKIIAEAGAGTAVPSGSAIATAARSEDITLTVGVSELDVARVKVGMPVRITVAAYPEEEISGRVSKIAPSAHCRYNGSVIETVVDVEMIPDTSDERLKSGLSACADIFLSEAREVLVLPYSAIGQDDSGEFVYVYENGKAVRREILTGAEFSDGAEITDGINSADIVFSDPEILVSRYYVRTENSGEEESHG